MALYPNLFLIGAAKGGSTTFAQHLNDHPDIAFFSVKEPNFFVAGSDDDCRAALRRHQHKVPKTRYLLDASVNYSQFPKFDRVPGTIANICGREAPRFLYMLRNPVDRAISQYFWRCERYGEGRPIEEAITQESQYVASSCYDIQIEHFLKVFAPEQFMFVIHEEYFPDVAQKYAEVCRWLDLDVHLPPKDIVRGATNKKFSRAARSPALNRFVQASPGLRRVVKTLLSAKYQHRLVRVISKEVPRPEVNAQLRDQLAGMFHDSIERTATLTGLDLSIWSVPAPARAAI